MLACGGIENARLLLLSRGTGDTGLGNGHDQVGRCLMNHPKNYRGLIHLREPVTSWPYMFGCMHRGFAGYAGLRLGESRQRELEVLNSYVRFEPIFPWSDDEGVESAVLIAKRSALALKALAGRSEKKVVELRDYSETGDDTDLQNARKSAADWFGVGWNVVRHAPSVAWYAYHRLSRVAPKVRTIRLRNFMEMEPHADNRVTLSERDDPFGRPSPASTTARPRSTDARSWPRTTPSGPRSRQRASGAWRATSPVSPPAARRGRSPGTRPTTWGRRAWGRIRRAPSATPTAASTVSPT